VNGFENFPGVYIDVDVPDWAVTAKITGFVEGLELTKAGNGALRVAFFSGGATQGTQIGETASSGRRSYNLGGKIAVPAAYRGTNKRLRVEGTVNNDASKGFLTSGTGSSGQIQVRFEERTE
jgi:hypothetical protein